MGVVAAVLRRGFIREDLVVGHIVKVHSVASWAANNWWVDAKIANQSRDRDVDYVVKNGAIESVDEFKGRIAQDRRWPAGLHTAIEAKEGVAFRKQGRVLGSITWVIS